MIKGKGKILIIADDQRFTSVIQELVKKQSCSDLVIETCLLPQGKNSVKETMPDVIIMDGDRYSKEKTAEYIRNLMPKYSRPLIVCTVKHNSNYGFMSAGASDVVMKPEEDSELFSSRLCSSLERLLKKGYVASTAPVSHLGHRLGKLIAIGGSTGSTQALPVILEGLKGDMPPIVAVLHMPREYTRIYAQQLDKTTRFDVVEAHSGLYLKNNMVVIAKGGEHLRVFSDKEGYFVTSEEGIKVSGHCPSVDVLFDSVAYCGKKNALGVILTGMGSDGAAGLLNMRKMGAVTLGQSREGCVVYGMPRAAFENGSVKRQVSLERMAGEIELRLKTMDKEGER
ncbi:chemotaxis protein CheB [Ruminococcus sp. FC2018]|uniref:chemotaxis protein CheB n=1 Tax=Ruminococcus sp. FC2018 TaxID=1410617 RepID=UPI0004916891|nr:chemotaxis protein CheB [Ruminococcus sp. FC2018]